MPTLHRFLHTKSRSARPARSVGGERGAQQKGVFGELGAEARFAEITAFGTLGGGPRALRDPRWEGGSAPTLSVG